MESPVLRNAVTGQCLLMLPLKQKNRSREVPLRVPCLIRIAVFTVPVAMLVPSLIICTDCSRLQREYDPHTTRPLHEESLHELKALGERVTYTRRAESGSLLRI